MGPHREEILIEPPVVGADLGFAQLVKEPGSYDDASCREDIAQAGGMKAKRRLSPAWGSRALF